MADEPKKTPEANEPKDAQDTAALAQPPPETEPDDSGSDVQTSASDSAPFTGKADEAPADDTYRLIVSQPAGSGHQRSRTLMAVMVVLALTIGVAGGYALGATLKQKSDKTSTATASPTPAKTSTTATAPAQSGPAADTTHFASSYSTPFDLKKHVLTALGLPANRQGVNIHSDNNDRGDSRYFTNKFNDEMGRWKISSLDPAKDATEIGLFAVGQEWLHGDQPADAQDSNLPINTAAQKATYIAALKTRTADCVKDKTKGFTIQSGTLNVCYSVIRGKYQGAKDGILELNGYGSIEGQPMLLTGLVDINQVDSNEANDMVTALAKTTFKTLD